MHDMKDRVLQPIQEGQTYCFLTTSLQQVIIVFYFCFTLLRDYSTLNHHIKPTNNSISLFQLLIPISVQV